MVVDTIVKGPPERVWRQTRAYGGIDRESYFAYFDGAEEANALHVASYRSYANPVPLSELRRKSPNGFTPPQYLAWLSSARTAALRTI